MGSKDEPDSLSKPPLCAFVLVTAAPFEALEMDIGEVGCAAASEPMLVSFSVVDI
jgi:hypothetical protein